MPEDHIEYIKRFDLPPHMIPGYQYIEARLTFANDTFIRFQIIANGCIIMADILVSAGDLIAWIKENAKTA